LDIDFHFGTTYVLSRWSGFDSRRAKAIAASSQLVDENTLQMAEPYQGRPTGHAAWENVTNADHNNDVWIPFHFLPGLSGETAEERLVCRKNSAVAQEMIHAVPQVTDQYGTLFQLGTTVHTYADTWAHQEFSGLADSINLVTALESVGIQLQLHKNSTVNEIVEDVVHSVTNLFARGTGALGHMSALHWPDMPFLEWKSKEKFPAGRKNWDEFMEASGEVFKVLSFQAGGTEKVLSAKQRGQLMESFREIHSTDFNERNDEWVRRIQANQFGFADFDEEDRHVVYDANYILHNPDFCRQFYQAVDQQYQWVRNRLDREHLDIEWGE
jgi:hypothetical protein